MKNRQPSQPRYIEQRRDDDEPGVPMAPWPWLEPASGQARRSEHQQFAHLEPISGR
jgi:hypothetical protein